MSQQFTTKSLQQVHPSSSKQHSDNVDGIHRAIGRKRLRQRHRAEDLRAAAFSFTEISNISSVKICQSESPSVHLPLPEPSKPSIISSVLAVWPWHFVAGAPRPHLAGVHHVAFGTVLIYIMLHTYTHRCPQVSIIGYSPRFAWCGRPHRRFFLVCDRG